MPSVKKELRKHGIYSVADCSLAYLVKFTNTTSLAKAVSALDALHKLALEPGLGGRWTESADLRVGDVLIVTTSPPPGAHSIAPVSNAMVNLGDGRFAGASGGVVRFRSLDAIMTNARAAPVVVRPYKPIPPPPTGASENEDDDFLLNRWGAIEAQTLVDEIKEGTPTRTGRARAIFRLDYQVWCEAVLNDAGELEKCKTWVGHVNLHSARNTDGFFHFNVPEFLANAFEEAGAPITQKIEWTQLVPTSSGEGRRRVVMVRSKPSQGEVVIRLAGNLGYVGHLKN